MSGISFRGYGEKIRESSVVFGDVEMLRVVYSEFSDLDEWGKKPDDVDESLHISYLISGAGVDEYVSKYGVEIFSRCGRVGINCLGLNHVSAIFSKTSMLEESLEEELWGKMPEAKKLFDAGVEAYEALLR